MVLPIISSEEEEEEEGGKGGGGGHSFTHSRQLLPHAPNHRQHTREAFVFTTGLLGAPPSSLSPSVLSPPPSFCPTSLSSPH